MATAVDLLLRLQQFEDYPFFLCRMSRRWFPETCDWACGRFLAADEAALDVGVGLVLHRMAWRKGDELAASRWLTGKAVQELVDDIIERLFVTSIEVERRHAEVKQCNSSGKLAHIATVSRNAIILRFSRWREQQCLALERAAEATRRQRRRRGPLWRGRRQLKRSAPSASALPRAWMTPAPRRREAAACVAATRG